MALAGALISVKNRGGGGALIRDRGLIQENTVDTEVSVHDDGMRFIYTLKLPYNSPAFRVGSLSNHSNTLGESGYQH